MRLVDGYLDIILLAKQLVNILDIRKADEQAAEESRLEMIRDRLIKAANDALSMVENAGYPPDLARAGLFPVVAFIDELILCSNWLEKSKWSERALQRHYFQTTNSGREFFDRMDSLSKSDNDMLLREVYLLCLSLGFRGQYFSVEDSRKIEQIKAINFQLLIPEAQQRNLDKATLFPAAYADQSGKSGAYKARLNFLPIVISVPIVAILGLAIYYQSQIAIALGSVFELLQ